MKILLDCTYLQTCDSDAFQGDPREWLCIQVTRRMSLLAVKRALHHSLGELRAEHLAGTLVFPATDRATASAWFDAARVAINRLTRAPGPRAIPMFEDAPVTKYPDSICAYFVFDRRRAVQPLRLTCAHRDTCLPDYFGGDSRPWVNVPVHQGISMAALKAALHSELNQGTIGGNDERTRDDSGPAGDLWFRAAHAAVNRMRRAPGPRGMFRELEKLTVDDTAVYAYFVFVPYEG